MRAHSRSTRCAGFRAPRPTPAGSSAPRSTVSRIIVRKSRSFAAACACIARTAASTRASGSSSIEANDDSIPARNVSRAASVSNCSCVGKAVAAVTNQILAGPFKASTFAPVVRRIRFIGADTAIVDTDVSVTNFRALPPGAVATKPGLLLTRLTDVFESRDGVWKIEASQNTAVLPSPGAAHRHKHGPASAGSRRRCDAAIGRRKIAASPRCRLSRRVSSSCRFGSAPTVFDLLRWTAERAFPSRTRRRAA